MMNFAQHTVLAIPHKHRKAMKALSVRQPWASRIRLGEKRIEVRSWPTEYRGPLVICATRRPRIGGLPVGVALCVVQLLDCRPMTVNDEPAAGVRLFPGAYAWVLGQVTPIEPPVPVSGRLGLFNIDMDRLARPELNTYRQVSFPWAQPCGTDSPHHT
jgi:hypothetical protein